MSDGASVSSMMLVVISRAARIAGSVFVSVSCHEALLVKLRMVVL